MEQAQVLQNVNLYLPELRPSRDWLDAKILAWGVLGCVLVLTLVSVYSHYSIKTFEQQAQSIQSTLTTERESLEKIKSKIPANKAEELDQHIAERQSQVRNLSMVAELIQSQNLGNDRGFASRFHSMAQRASSDVALSHFRFSQGDRKVELAGETRDPRSLTEFIDALQRDGNFQGAHFGPLALQYLPNKNKHHRFSLGFKQVFEGDNKLVEANR